MFKPNQNNKKGFTIIEVVLVLAIAGLIFLMVFIALPALQRSQRDAQRKEDIGKVLSQLQIYQSNNRGRIPGESTTTTGGGGGTGSDLNFEGWTSEDNKKKNIKDTKTWQYFYSKYLISENGDDFQDPSGKPYGMKIIQATSGDTAGAATGLENDFKTQFDNGAKMVVVTHSRCDGESTTYVSQQRNVSVLYRGESGNIICQNN